MESTVRTPQLHEIFSDVYQMLLYFVYSDLHSVSVTTPPDNAPPRDILPGDYHPQRKFANWHQPVLPTLTDTRGEEFFKNGTNTRTPDDIRLGAGNPLGGYLQGGASSRTIRYIFTHRSAYLFRYNLPAIYWNQLCLCLQCFKTFLWQAYVRSVTG